MQPGKIEQYQFESDAWKRALYFMTEESFHAKSRITSLLRGAVDRSLLDDLDNFQAGFIEKEEAISALRTEVMDFDKMLQKATVEEDGKFIRMLSVMANRIRREVHFLDLAFDGYSKAFFQFLLENC